MSYETPPKKLAKQEETKSDKKTRKEKSSAEQLRESLDQLDEDFGLGHGTEAGHKWLDKRAPTKQISSLNDSSNVVTQS